MSDEIYIKGFSKSHGFIVSTSLVNDEVLNFTFNNSENTIRDLLLENIGDSTIYVRFSKNVVSSIDIDTGTTKKTGFSNEATGWALMPDRPLALSYCDYTNIGLVCATGESSKIQIMGVLATNNSNLN
jgi:hypothetical protein